MHTPNGAMTAKQFNDALRALGLSVYASPNVLGISLRQAQRYSSGEQEIAQPIANHLRLLLLHIHDLKQRRQDLINGIRVLESGESRTYSGRINTTTETLHRFRQHLSDIEKLLTNHPTGLKSLLD
jgi:hypothetical protein